MKINFKSFKSLPVSVLCFLAVWPVAVAGTQSDIKVEHLSPLNSFVRVNGTGKYLMIPIEEAIEDAEINVIVDGKLEKTFYARLAQSEIDYSVPFDLSGYEGKNIIFDVNFDKTFKSDSADVCWTNFFITDTFNTTNSEIYRPAFHHTPLYGWMNDPNGMFYKDGVWHLYYQWNPYGSKWQNMTWGHSSSTDLINWQHLDAAIEPNILGAAFSGSSAIDRNGSAGFGENTVITMYTTAGTNQTQSLGWSTDNGQTFTLYPGNPVITLDSEARDPNMFWNEKTGEWNLILAHALDREMLIFSSPDMKEWTLESSFGKGLGAQGGVWECPDLFQLPVEGTNQTKWVLVCNINPGGPFGGSGTQYFVGDFDGKKFTVDKDVNGVVPTKWMDYGKDNYANVSWSDAPDGRRVIIGWMSNWQYAADIPTLQFRSANTLPRDLSLFRAKDGDIYLASRPSKEVDALRGTLCSDIKNKTISSKGESVSLPTENSGICEIDMKIDARSAKTFTITLSNDKGEEVTMNYSPLTDKLSFDRTKSGQVDFSDDFPAITLAPIHSGKESFGLRIFVDTSSIEVFEERGRAVMTNLVFPTAPYTTLTLKSEGGASRISNLKIYSITPTK